MGYLSLLGLEFEQLRIAPVRRKQFPMRALFSQNSVPDHANQIGIANGGEMVRDDDRGSAFHQFVEGFYHLVLRIGVKPRSRFV